MEILIVLLLAIAWALLAVVLPVLSFIRASAAASHVRDFRDRLAAIESKLADLAAQRARPSDAAAAPPASPSAIEQVESEVLAPVEPITPPPLPPVDAGLADVPEPSVEPHDVRAPAPVEASSAGEGRPASAAEETIGLEQAIGGRLLLYVGTVVIVLGAAFFLKYAFERAWITESMRVGLGAAAGIGLIAAGTRLGSRGYTLYGQVLTGGGLAVLYLAVYAAFGFYGLIAASTAFVLLTLITVGTAVLADRQASQPMAHMAIGGGFLTPFLVGGTTDAQVILFSYVILLVLGTLFLARRHRWPLLNVFSYALTIFTLAAWADAYYSRAKYLRTELFLSAFCALFLGALADARGLKTHASRIAATILVSAPVLYHVVSLGVLAPHGVTFLVYIIAFTVVGVGWAARVGTPEMRVLLWMSALVPLIGWLDVHQTRTWIAPGLVTLGAVFVLHQLPQVDHVSRRHGRVGPVDLLLLHLNGLGLFAGVYVLLARQALQWVPTIGAGLAVLHAALWWWMRERDSHASLHALAVTFTLVAATVGVRLDGAWLTAAWAAEGAAVTWIGLRLQREWFRAGGAVLLIVAIERWLVLSVVQPVPASFTLFANEPAALGAWIICLLYALAWAHRGSAGSPLAYPRSIAALLVSASAATVVLLSQQNQAYWEIRGGSYADATFAGQLTLSLIWALYAGVLIVIGIRRAYRPIRYAAIALFGVTVGKVFLVDLAGLQGIYRVMGLLAVGTILLLVSFLYQRRRTGIPPPA
jgi:uncharacterized membrane protein